jgi:ABC-type sugar transport system ATPase subunit
MTLGPACVMRHGAVVQVGPPLELYRQPADTFVATFLGSPPMNLLGGSSRARVARGRRRHSA